MQISCFFKVIKTWVLQQAGHWIILIMTPTWLRMCLLTITDGLSMIHRLSLEQLLLLPTWRMANTIQSIHIAQQGRTCQGWHWVMICVTGCPKVEYPDDLLQLPAGQNEQSNNHGNCALSQISRVFFGNGAYQIWIFGFALLDWLSRRTLILV